MKWKLGIRGSSDLSDSMAVLSKSRPYEAQEAKIMINSHANSRQCGKYRENGFVKTKKTTPMSHTSRPRTFWSSFGVQKEVL